MPPKNPQNTGVDPRHVISPMRNFQLIEVLYEGQWYSTAIGRWRTEGEDEWRPVVATRWNGWNGGKGTPTVRGYPCWHVVPDNWYPILFCDSDLRDFVPPIPPERRADVWRFLGLDQQGPGSTAHAA